MKKVGKFPVKPRGALPGEQHPLAKLTWEKVDRIRELHKSGLSYRKLGKMFDVSNRTTRDICLYMTWVRPGEKRVPYGQPNGNRTGERHPKARMTEEKVREARKRFAMGECKSVRALAFEFGVTRNAMVDIIDGRTWKGVV